MFFSSLNSEISVFQRAYHMKPCTSNVNVQTCFIHVHLRQHSINY